MGRRICELLSCELSYEDLLLLQAIAFEVDPRIVSIAQQAAKRVQVGILSNNAPLMNEALPVHFPKLAQVFDPILFSFQFGSVKPERGLFEAVQAHLAVPPGDIVFIDDNSGHVAAARAVGWDAMIFESPEQLRRSLVERGLIASAV
jgi:HAD superfamily hydrolase (TIGR01509 family)